MGDLAVFLLLAVFLVLLAAFLVVPVAFFLGAAFLVVDLVEAAFLVDEAFLVALVAFLLLLLLPPLLLAFFLVDEEEALDEEEPEEEAVDAFLADFLAASPSANFWPVCLSTPLSTPRFRACRTRESLFFASRSA